MSDFIAIPQIFGMIFTMMPNAIDFSKPDIMSRINYLAIATLLFCNWFSSYAQDNIPVRKFPIITSKHLNFIGMDFEYEHYVFKNTTVLFGAGLGLGYGGGHLVATGKFYFDYRYYPWLEKRYLKGRTISNFNGFYIAEHTMYQIRKQVGPIFYLYTIPLSAVAGYQTSFLKIFYTNIQFGYGVLYFRARNDFTTGMVGTIGLGCFLAFPKKSIPPL